MDAKETIRYLYEHGHIPQNKHFIIIVNEIDQLQKDTAYLRTDNTKLGGKIVALKYKNNEIQAEIAEAKKGVFGFMIKPDETLTEGMNRNYAEFDDCRTKLEAEDKDIIAELQAGIILLKKQRYELKTEIGANEQQFKDDTGTIKQLQFELNASQEQLDIAKIEADEDQAEIVELKEALEELLDRQNGPPLIRKEKKWQAAVDKANKLLGRQKRG